MTKNNLNNFSQVCSINLKSDMEKIRLKRVSVQNKQRPFYSDYGTISGSHRSNVT